MPKGYITRPKWTQKQREIYKLLAVDGLMDEEARAAGYGIENILRVRQAIGRGESPPSSPAPEASMEPPHAGGNGSKPPSKTAGTPGTVEHSVIATIKPRDATIYSSLLWQAKQAAIKVLGWPADMTDSQFLDKWLKKSFAAFGIHIGDYWVEPTVKVAQPLEQEEYNVSAVSDA